MAGGGDSRDSATEINRLLMQVRVERQGKSLPPFRQLSGLCKPHLKQGPSETHGIARSVSMRPHDDIGDDVPR